MATPEASTKSLKGNASIDTNQLLALCQRIRDTMGLVEQRISVTQLRIITFSYVMKDLGASESGHALKLSDNLIELCHLSQSIVQLLDELHSKLKDNQDLESVNSQIASQQLVFFTSEWYDNLSPKLNEIFYLAETISRPTKVVDGQQQQKMALRYDEGSLEPDSEGAIRDALLRLRQSMSENERLIGTISANIEYTRSTIESIYDSLQSTKIGLNKSEQNAIRATSLLRNSNRCIVCSVICIMIPLTILIIYVIVSLVSLFF